MPFELAIRPYLMNDGVWLDLDAVNEPTQVFVFVAHRFPSFRDAPVD
ncbi:hypothetical protein Pla52n_06550 [Stieleria varia]|uniref:Uncharacterized protein n=1 Tax=Stieleria varia TaxID=2528005 RepID=A0A5C6BC16_9BACT|nr:hypothetical protein Pla52n_06550 [Stieleria varia]